MKISKILKNSPLKSLFLYMEHTNQQQQSESTCEEQIQQDSQIKNTYDFRDFKYSVYYVKVCIIDVFDGVRNRTNKDIYFRLNDLCKPFDRDFKDIRKTKQFQQAFEEEQKLVPYPLRIRITDVESNSRGEYYSEHVMLQLVGFIDMKYLKDFLQIRDKYNDYISQKQEIQQNTILKDEQLYMQMQVQQQQQKPALYQYLLTNLQGKVSDDLLKLFACQLKGIDVWIHEDFAIKILGYTTFQSFNGAVEKYVLNQDYITQAPAQAEFLQFREEQKTTSKKKQIYMIKLECLEKMLLNRDTKQSTQEVKDNVKNYVKFLKQIKDCIVQYSIQEQHNEIQIQDDVSESQLEDDQEELKQDHEGNLQDHNGQIVQHNQQLQVIQDQIYNINDLSLKQLYMILGKLECYNSNERQKKFLIQIVEMRIQLLEKDSQIELQKKDNQIELQKKDTEISQTKNQLELQKKDTEILQTKSQLELQKKDTELLLKDKEIELKDKELSKQNEMKKYLEESLKICQEWILYILYYVQEEIDIINDKLLQLINTHVKNNGTQTQKQEQLIKCYQLLSEFLKTNYSRMQQRTDDINDMNDIMQANNKDYLPFYIGICQQNRSQIRPYEHYDSVIKLLSYIDQSKNLYKYRELCKYLQQHNTSSRYFYQTKICTLSNTDKILRDIETKKIQQLMANNPQITNKENYNKFRDGKKYKIIHDYLTENGLKKAGDIKF